MTIIDVHIHVQPWNTVKPEVYKTMIESRKDSSRLLEIMRSPTKLIEYFDSQGVEKAVIINYPSPEVMGFTESVNKFVLDYTKDYRSRLLPCGGIIYNRSATETEKYVRDLIKQGIRAFKIQTTHQLCHPNDYTFNKSMESFYKVLQAEGVPVIIHTGTSIFPGARNKFGHPLSIDDVAVDFPSLKIVLAHIGRPLWPNESLFLLRRHKNVFADISSIPPKNLLSYFSRLESVSEKLFFGSDWPAPGVPDIEKNVGDFMQLNLSKETKENILCNNASKIFEWK